MSTRLEGYQGAPEGEGQIYYESDWYLLSIPTETHKALLPLLATSEATSEATSGVSFKPITRPHISVMKNEAPCQNQADWGVAFVGETVRYQYNPVLRSENGLHIWLDCYSSRLCEMRSHFGLVTLMRDDGTYLVNFHLTLARRKQAIEPQPRPRLRLCPQSYIDAETGMQHL